MLLLTFDEKSGKPKYQQIIDQIRQKIESRSLIPGEKLPSTRQLAEKLGVHRSTTSLAYQELWALGYIELHPCKSPRVRSRMAIAKPSDDSNAHLIDWNRTASTASTRLWETYRDFLPPLLREKKPGYINFRPLDMDSRLFPIENFNSCMSRVLKTKGHTLLGYGDETGYAPLKSYIAHRMQNHGVSVSSDEILITNGSQQGIDLILRMIASPGRTVALESPSYNHMMPLIHLHEMKPLEIPILKDGMDLDLLEEKLKNESPSLIYTMPNFQNPTGISTGQAHRERLLSLAEQYRIPILEDGFEEEMKYFGKVVLPVKSMDKHQIVIYCGTFSKVLFPGVRIGWIAADKECISRIAAIRRFSELNPGMIMQAAIYEFCINGYYDRHIGKMHRVFRKRMQTSLKNLETYISPQWAEWVEPAGGFLIWLKLKKAPASPNQLEDLFNTYKVNAIPGNFFFLSGCPDTYLRLSISTLDENEIEEGIKRLSRVLEHMFNN